MKSDHAWQLETSDGAASESGFVEIAQHTQPSGHLPEPVTSFIGREDDLDALAALATTSRLVTIVGPAGAGKTRLAIEHARVPLWERRFAGGVWLCDLTEARTVRGICASVAGCLGVPLGGSGNEDVQRLTLALQSRGPTLLLLDNFEQLVACAPDIIMGWLEHTPETRFVVTSRVRTGIAGERVLELGPLPLPGASADPWRVASVRLFVDRARSVRFGYEPRGELAAILEIVRRLDGLPLAIELAASRMSVLGAVQIASHLTQRFELLRSSDPSRPRRQATMRGAIAWSWELLEPEEQVTLAQCSVFRDGFELDAIRSVVRLGERRGSLWLLDLVQALVDKSLVQAYAPARGRGELRYRLLESVREFGVEQLAQMAQTAEVEERHDAHYAELARRLLEQVAGRGADRALELCARELENLLAVHRRNLTREGAISAERALVVACALEPLLATRGSPRTLASLLDATLERHGGVASPALEAACVLARGRALAEIGYVDASRSERERALRMAQASGDLRLEGRALASLARHAWRRGQLRQAADLATRAMAIHQEAGDPCHEGRTASHRARCLHLLGDCDEARAGYHSALRLIRAHGDRRSEAITLGHLGNLEQDLGDAAGARDRFERALEILRGIGGSYDEGHLLTSLGTVALELGDCDEARRCYQEAADCHRVMGNQRGEGMALAYGGLCAESDGHSAQARRHYRDALELLAGHGPPLLAALVHAWLGRLEADGGQLAVARRQLAAAKRLIAALGDTILALLPALCTAHLWLAEAGEAAIDGDYDEAEQHRERARELVVRLRSGGERHHSCHVRLALARLRAALGTDAPRLSWAPPSVAELGDVTPSDSVDLTPSESALTVSASGRSFCVPGGEPVDLSTRRAPRLILRALADQREEQPGVALGLSALLEAGWPGERPLAEAGATRVYTAIATLRRMGLKAWLLRRDDGYLIDPAAPLVRWGAS